MNRSSQIIQKNSIFVCTRTWCTLHIPYQINYAETSMSYMMWYQQFTGGLEAAKSLILSRWILPCTTGLQCNMSALKRPWAFRSVSQRFNTLCDIVVSYTYALLICHFFYWNHYRSILAMQQLGIAYISRFFTVINQLFRHRFLRRSYTRYGKKNRIYSIKSNFILWSDLAERISPKTFGVRLSGLIQWCIKQTCWINYIQKYQAIRWKYQMQIYKH